MIRPTLIALGLLATGAAPAAGDVDELRAELARQRSLIEQQQARLEALADAVDQKPAAAALAGTRLGMYGEVHFNHLREAGPAVGGNNIHAHRVVFLVGHQFSDAVKFYSELEFEGAPDSTDVETEVEQFFVNLRLNENYSLDVGQFLLPVGLLNETHEPNAFYGVERNPVEEFVIPATWWERA